MEISHLHDETAYNAAESSLQPGARADEVMRKMRYLTGMAAIGGFLFGYDTGKTKTMLLAVGSNHVCWRLFISKECGHCL
jgi:hypothetical protein